MKKMLVLAALIGIVLAHYSLAAHYKRSNTDYWGWPIPYQSSQELFIQPVLCNGFNTDLSSNTTCNAAVPSNNYFAMAGDIVLCVLVGLTVSYGAFKLDKVRL